MSPDTLPAPTMSRSPVVVDDAGETRTVHPFRVEEILVA